ncbi:MAG: FAD-dependent oxidoreductase [Gammaproteobacteria bacterium]|nr:FAD-dependent oxidoreductase [Gammaproteobacteria bacterium]
MTEPDSNSSSCKVDILIFGGGIAGLWLLNRLHDKGFNVILLEAKAMGSGQSVASQGIIHGGLKYALSGSVSTASNAIASMPAHWRACLDGKGDIDLSRCNLLSEQYFMWSDGSLRSRLKTFLGSKSLRGKIKLLAEDQYPPFFADCTVPGSLYQLPDFVIDTGSLIASLSAPHKDRIFCVEPSDIEFLQDNGHGPDGVRIKKGGRIVDIKFQRSVFAAGEGNLGLMQKAGLDSPAMQVRPLNMVMLRKKHLPLLYLHCIGDSFSLSPVLTLTSHVCKNGDVVWYLGGEIAESGVARNRDQQIRAASELLNKLFPWLNLTDARWECLPINRAEGKAAGQHRPDAAFLQTESRIMVAWPTKFTLSPALAEEVLSALEIQAIVPKFCQPPELLYDMLPTPSLALSPWETLFDHA